MRLSSALRASIVLATALAALPAGAVRAPEGGVLPDLDVRLSRNARYQAAVALQHGTPRSELIAGPVADPGEARRAALLDLAKTAGQLEVRWDDVTGSPRLLFARQGFLTAPDSRPAEAIARDFLVAHRDLFLLDEKEARELPVYRLVPTSAGGTVVRFEQSIAGIDVLHGHLAVAVTGEGRIVEVAGGNLSGAGSLGSTQPASTPAQALDVLAAMVGVSAAKMPEPLRADAGSATFRLDGLRSEATVSLVTYPTIGGPRLGWIANLSVAKSPMTYEVVVDDATLQPVKRVTRTRFLDTRGQVFTNSPLTGTHDETRFVDPSDYRLDQSPSGWADEAASPIISTGNNVVVQDDIANDDEATPGRHATAAGPGPGWLFDFPFTDGSIADQDASLTNLFWAVNRAHDRFYDLGFDERSGNFQSQNFSRGGLGNDPVLADDMDGSGTNNANFDTPPDGASGRMQMYLWDMSGSSRSSSFEVGVVTHEFGHGVSNRLVGGPADADCLFGFQSGAMGEAWSDYFAGSFLDDTVVAEWVSGDPNGIRMFRLDENPPNGKDYRSFCTYANDMAPQLCEPHDNGEMWSGLLWLIREQYVATYGQAEGVRRADQLVLDALKYTICAPSMLDARDALILADRLETGGQMECVIKDIAASRWMGFDASSTGGSDTQPVAGNQPWPECVSLGVLRFDREGLDAGGARATYSCDDQVGVLLTDGNYVPAPDSITVVVLRASVEVDRETLTPAPGDGPGAFSASIHALNVAGAPLDGTLNVQPGDVLEASYVDGGSIVRTQADVACAARLSVIRHRVLNGSCDADALPNYPELPGFVDAGETADVEVELANLAPVQLSGLLHVSSADPNLVILPQAPIPVTFPPAIGTSPASIVVRLKAQASLAAIPGEIANVEFWLETPSFDGSVAATLPLELAMDYDVQAGLTFSYDMEGESAPAGPDWTRGELGPATGDQWTIVSCDNTTPGGTKAFRNGPANCSGRYSDSQGNPYIVSPAMNLFDATTRAARVTGAQWQNKINLGVIGFPPNIPLAVDADAVVVTLSNDPAALDPTDVIAIATSSLAFYIHVDIPGFYSQNSNTTSWVLDQRTPLPGQFAGVDFAQPAYLTWYFLPDVTFVQPPLDAQGNGYYLDDVQLTYERVVAVPQAATCTPTTAVLSLPFISEPALASGCPNDRTTIDASASELSPCGAGQAEYRFTVGGVPEPCFQPDGVTPRVQDVDGWGSLATCTVFPAADRTFDVDVRCAADPTVVDRASTTVRIVDGLPVLTGSQRAFCAGSGDTIVVDASSSSLVGCPGPAEYAFSDGAGPLDCDGDTVPDGWTSSSTCTVGPSNAPLDVTVGLRCAALPGCEMQDTITIPAVSATASGALLTPAPGGYFCTGSTATLDASASVVTGCTGGQPQYHWTTTGGFDSGWITSPTLDVTVTGDADYVLEARCSLSTSCVSAPAAPVQVLERTGAFSLSQQSNATDCAGDLFRLEAGVRNPPGARCNGNIEYRFTQQTMPGPTLTPVTCFDDQAGTTPRTQDANGWGVGTTCWTPQIAGGADFVVEYRCSDDASCTMETSLPRHVVPQTGVPAGTTPGLLIVKKSANGCVPNSDIRLSWADTDYNPLRFLVFRSDDPQVDTTTERLGPVDDITYTDVGASCDTGGTPYLGVRVYFYVHAGRNTCTDEPLP